MRRGAAWLLLAALAAAPGAARAEFSPEDILLKTDEVRNPQMDYTVHVAVTTEKPGRATSVSTYEVLVKGREDAVIKTLSPPIERGRVLLMKSHDLWAFLPDVSKPLRVSLQERLTGQVANGDLARANFSGDYTAALAAVEKITGENYFVMDLAAKAPDVTYGRVKLWVHAQTFYPLKAEFYAISGRLLKTCSYEDYRQLGGRLRPTRLVMSDPILSGSRSILEYNDLTIEDLPEKYFTKDYLKKLSD